MIELRLLAARVRIPQTHRAVCRCGGYLAVVIAEGDLVHAIGVARKAGDDPTRLRVDQHRLGLAVTGETARQQ